MINRSTEFRNLISEGLKMQNLKATDINSNENIMIKDADYKFNASLFKSVMRTINFSIKNGNVHNKNLKIEYGLLVNGNFEYLNLGTFFVKDIEDKKKSETITAMGYDKMLNFMVDFDFKALNINLPCTLIQFLKALALYCNVEIYSENFINRNLIINEDFFTNQNMTCRDVLDKIAEATLTIIFIKDDKLYLKELNSSNIIENLTAHDIEDLVIHEKFGPLNSLILGRGDVGDDVSEFDEKSIELNGLQEIRIDENELLDSNRVVLKKQMFNRIKGLEFYSFESKDLGFIYLEPGDFIIQSDRVGNQYLTLILNLSAKITTGISQTTNADIPETVTSNFKYTTKEVKRTLKVERIAKKNEGVIQDLVQENSELENKITEHQQTINEISDRVNKTSILTNELEGINQIKLENSTAGGGYVIQFTIQGEMPFLAPSENLTPSNNLVPLGDHFTLVIDIQGRSLKSENAVEIDVPLKEPLRILNSKTCDEILYEDGNFYCIRKVAIDDDLHLYELPEPKKEELCHAILPTFDKSTYIYALEYLGLDYYVYYITKNDYDRVFATKAELGSSIKLTEDTILQKVNLEYTTKGETRNIEALLELKVDLNDLISQINASADVINLKAGRLLINSGNFQLDENGRITAISGSVGGFELSRKNFHKDISGNYEFTADDIVLACSAMKDYCTLPNEIFDLYDYNADGSLNMSDIIGLVNTIKGTTSYVKKIAGSVEINSDDMKNTMLLKNNTNTLKTLISMFSIFTEILRTNTLLVGNYSGINFTGVCVDSNKKLITVTDGSNESQINPTEIKSQAFNNNSLISMKENIKKSKSYLDDVLKADICEFNYKGSLEEKIGLVIGRDFNTPEKLLNLKKNAVDLYSMISMLYKAFQEEHENTKKDIQTLNKRIEILEKRLEEKDA